MQLYVDVVEEGRKRASLAIYTAMAVRFGRQRRADKRRKTNIFTLGLDSYAPFAEFRKIFENCRKLLTMGRYVDRVRNVP